jgi:N-acetylglucosaminyldiphosphoundecaprenol N-acetyl-beta-D-mannosaminyltransferase
MTPEMDACVRRCEVVNADGASMVMAAQKLGVSLPERVAGVDLMQELCKMAAERSHTVYLLGAKAEIVEKTAQVLRATYPGLNVVGFRDGYFGNDEFDSVVSEVEETHPDIVFVGITSPKKERLIERFRELGATGAFVGVGGSFDVISGNIPPRPYVDAAGQPGMVVPHDAGAGTAREALCDGKYTLLDSAAQGNEGKEPCVRRLCSFSGRALRR